MVKVFFKRMFLLVCLSFVHMFFRLDKDTTQPVFVVVSSFGFDGFFHLGEIGRTRPPVIPPDPSTRGSGGTNLVNGGVGAKNPQDMFPWSNDGLVECQFGPFASPMETGDAFGVEVEDVVGRASVFSGNRMDPLDPWVFMTVLMTDIKPQCLGLSLEQQCQALLQRHMIKIRGH